MRAAGAGQRCVTWCISTERAHLAAVAYLTSYTAVVRANLTGAGA
jgi:hypothetical protein